MTNYALALCIGLAIDLAVGWPDRLYARIGHPVGWLARLIRSGERRLNHGSPRQRFLGGMLVSLSAIVAATAVWGAFAWLAQRMPLAPLWMGLLFWPLIAARSMHQHVAAIEAPLARGDLDQARHAVSMIVGRDPTALDTSGIARATLESLSENTSDGVVAPIFWGLLLGPAGMAGYKAVNTLDSMIGHRSERYEWFGKAAARIDDAANLLPARLTGLTYALVSGRRARRALAVIWRDARTHRSPNAGWPEAAMAAGVGVRLSGPRVYGDRIADEPWLNGNARDPDAVSIRDGLRLYRRLVMALGAALLVAALAG